MYKEYPISCPENHLEYQHNLLSGIFKIFEQEKITSKIRPVLDSIHEDNLKIFYFDKQELNGVLLKVDLGLGNISLIGEEKKIDRLHGMLESILKINLEAQFEDLT